MRQECALDHLPTTAVEPADPERSVPNPRWARRSSASGAQLTKAEQAYGQQAHDHPAQPRRTVPGFKISHAAVGREIKELRAARERLDTAIRALPPRVPVREVMNGEPIVRLERERKTITDTFFFVERALPPFRRCESGLHEHRVPLGRCEEAEKGETTVRLLR